MSFLKFNQVFTSLMLLALLSAFFVPQNLTGIARAQVQNVFAPIARPTRLAAFAILDRFHPANLVDPSSPHDIGQLRAENDQLRQLNASLAIQLEKLKELNADRKQLGDLRAYCTAFAVFASDSGVRQSPYLKGSSFDGLKQDMAVICPAGLVGRLNRTGAAGASVRLITDPGFRVQGAFGRFVNSGDKVEFQLLAVQQFILQGLGDGVMGARFINFAEQQRAGLRENDWIILSDPDYPPILQATRLGRVTRIMPQHDGPGYAEIRAAPVVNLMQLKDLLVMDRSEGRGARGK